MTTVRHSQQGFIDAVKAAYYKFDDAVSPEEFCKICNGILETTRLHKNELFTVISRLLCEEYEKSLALSGTQSRIFHDANVSAYLRFHNEFTIREKDKDQKV